MKNPSTQHLSRLASEIQKTLLLVLRESYEADLGFIVSIVGVEITADQSYAKIHCTFFALSPQSDDACLEKLQQRSSELRHALSQRIQTRHTPKLQFYMDHLTLEARRVDEILSKSSKKDES